MLATALALAALAAAPAPADPARPPVWIGLDLALTHPSGTSERAVERGARIAADEVNAAGGVLGGRPVAVVVLDNRAVPARGVENFRELAAKDDLVAVIGGKHSPVLIEQVPLAHELGVPLLSAWAAADPIIQHGRAPSWTFRLSMRDVWAMDTLLAHCAARGLSRVGLLLPNGGWGRSNAAAAAAYATRRRSPQVVATRWYNWGVETLAPEYAALRAAGAQAIVLVSNEQPAAFFLREVAALPPAERLPIVAHHGVAGGDLYGLAGLDVLHAVDLSVVQFFTFAGATHAQAVALGARQAPLATPHDASAAGGVAAAHDLVHLLALAVDRAGGTGRAAVRDALERLGPFDGAVRSFRRPFTPDRHEALGPEDLFMARFADDGALVRAGKRAR